MTNYHHRVQYVCVSYLHLRQLPDHLDLLLQDSPQRLLRCCLIVVFVLLKSQELLAHPLLRLGLRERIGKDFLQSG